jgi:predicted secreted protein
MSLTTSLAAFFLIWWVSLFAVLPWGVRSQHEGGEMAPGTDPGAPTSFRLGRTLLWTTGVALVIYAGVAVVYVEHLVTLDGLMAEVGIKLHNTYQ